MKMLVFFLAKKCLNCCKNHGCGQKKSKSTSSAYLALKPLRNAANPSKVPTEFAAEAKRQI